MSDIVEWLRDRAFRKSGPTMEAAHTKQQEWVWADEITRLREENERLKAALEDVLSDIAKSEHVNNLYPSPGKSRFWKSVVNAEKLLK